MGLLDGNLSRSIYAGFRGKLLKGVIRRAMVPEDADLDEAGDPPAAVPSDTALEGFSQSYSRFTASTAGIPATDLQVNIFAASMPGFRPLPEDKVRLDRKNGPSQWYQIRGPIGIDEAGVLWVCQSFEIPAPQ